MRSFGNTRLQLIADPEYSPLEKSNSLKGNRMGRGVAEPWTEPPAHPLAAAAPDNTLNTTPSVATSADALTIRDGGAEWILAADDVLFVAEPSACLTPIPHAPATVRGLACIEGRPFAVVDSAADSGARKPGGALVVVASGDGGVALRVDAVTRKGGAVPVTGDGPDLLAHLAPWVPPAAGRRTVVAPLPMAAAISLLFVTCGSVTAALSITTPGAGSSGAGLGVTIERVGLVGFRQPLRAKGVDALVRVDDFLLPARSLADALPIPPVERTGGVGERWAVVLGFDGQRAALLVDRVVEVTSCDPRQIIAMALPGGTSQLWLDRPDMPPVPVVDAATLFGWPPAAASAMSCAPSAVADGGQAEPVLTVQAADVGLALPLALIDRVLEPDSAPTAERTPGALPVFDAAVALGRRCEPRHGTLIRLRPEGAPPFILSVDRTSVIAEPESPWLVAHPLPPLAALSFDAVGLAAGMEGEGGRWLYRLRSRLPSPSVLSIPVRRCLAAARLGWVATEAMPETLPV
jgi:chemotaxis signal transduction protein